MSTALTDLMHQSTDDLELRAGFAEAVLRGGRRRQLRRRTAMTGTVAALGLAGAAGLVRGLPDAHLTGYAGGQPTPGSSPISSTQGGALADGRRHGDLAGDQAYLDAVQRAWTSWMATRDEYEHPRGKAEIIWAGTTPAGPAALLQQEIELTHKVGETGPGRYSALGFIGVGSDGPRVAAALYNADVRNSLAWYVDQAHRTLVVTDNGVPRGVSFGWRYGKTGHRTRIYEPLTFRDGIAVVTLPQGVDRTTVAVSDLPGLDRSGAVYIANIELDGSLGDAGYMSGLDWTDPRGALGLPFSGGPALTPQQAADGYFAISTRLTGITRGSYLFGGPGRGMFLIYGTAPNGAQVCITQDQLEGDQAQLFMTYGDELIHVGVADASATLPVRAELPDGQGWVVARLGAALRYRVGNGAWITANSDAALLPAAATAVEVTPRGERPRTVSLV